jgi:hypothetical protein
MTVPTGIMHLRNGHSSAFGEHIVPESTCIAIELPTPPGDPITEAVARRIDEVLRERKRNAAERRTRELETQPGYLRVRAAHLDKLANVSPELRERRGSRMKTVEAAFEAVMASNAACEALSDQSR